MFWKESMLTVVLEAGSEFIFVLGLLLELANVSSEYERDVNAVFDVCSGWSAESADEGDIEVDTEVTVVVVVVEGVEVNADDACPGTVSPDDEGVASLPSADEGHALLAA
jgi:hypothetical protein